MLDDLYSGYLHLPTDNLSIVEESCCAAQNFFSKDLTYKQNFCLANEIESGYYHLGHKEYFGVRTDALPIELSTCKELYTYCYSLANQILKQIAKLLHWDEKLLTGLTQESASLQTVPSSSLLRLISYAPVEREIPACDAHQDLGLISLVFATAEPALEAFNFKKDEWENLEQDCPLHTCIVMIGETLSLLSNGFLLPATHRVKTTKRMRTSLVFQLRADSHAILDSTQFENPLTGKFTKPFKQLAQDFYANERVARNSVNNSY